MFCTSPINSEIPFIFTDAAIPFLPGEGGLSNGEDFPQQPAPVLIGPNSKLFGSKLNATTIQKTNRSRLVFFRPFFPSIGAGSGLAATDVAAQEHPVSGGFPLSVPTHSLFLRRTPSRPLKQ